MAYYEDNPFKPSKQPPAGGAPAQQPTNQYYDKNPFAVANDDETATKLREGTFFDDVKGTSRALVEGLTVGFSDEIGVGIAAAMVSLTGQAADGDSIADIYKQMKRQYEKEQNAFKEDSPYLAAGAEIAGAVLSPLNKIAPATGLKSAVGRGAAEGAAYGYGSSSTDASASQQIANTAMGAGFGGGVPVLLGGATKLVNEATKRRIAQELGSGDDFISIPLAANRENATEGALANFYRSIVGVAYGGREALKTQQDRVIGKAKDALSRKAEAAAKVKRNADAAVAATKQKIKNLAESKIQTVKDDIALTREAGAAAREAAKEGIEVGKAGVYRAVKDMEDEMDAALDMFRMDAFSTAIPAGATQREIVEVLNAPSANAANLKLQKLWDDYGFKSLTTNAKGGAKQYRINPEKIRDELQAAIEKSEIVKLQGFGKSEIANQVDNVFNYLKNNTRAGGFIDGEAVSAARSTLGTAAAKAGDERADVLAQTAYREAQGIINNLMRKQLSGDALAQFDNHVAQWKSKILLDDSVLAASGKGGKQGAFTPDNWLEAIKRNSSRDARFGEGPLRKEADALARSEANRVKTLKEAADALKERVVKEETAKANRARAQVAAELKKLRKQQQEIKRKSGVDMANAERMYGNNNKIAQLEAEAAKLKQRVDALDGLRIADNPSTFQSLFSLGLLSSAAGLATGSLLSVGSIAGGVGIAKALSTQSAQRAVAGQTGVQKAVQEQLPQFAKNLPEFSQMFQRITRGGMFSE